MPFEIVTLNAAGLALKPITIAITMAMDEAARSFSAKIKDPLVGQAALLEKLASSPAVTIHARASAGIALEPQGGGTLLLTGHVEQRLPRLSGTEKELSISGRSKTGDVVDSAHGHKTGELRSKTAKDGIGEITKEFNVSVESDVAHQPRDVFRLRPGETVFRAAERWARAEGFTIGDTAEGNIKLAKGASKRHAGAIRDGAGVLPVLIDASAKFDDSKRFSSVKVKAQAPDGYGADKLEIEDEAKDEGVARLRRKVIVPPEEIKKKDARTRAKWHRDRAAGKGTTCEVRVKGWRDQAGTIWTPGWLVAVEIADLGLLQDMLVQKVSLEQSGSDSDDGTVASLSLVDPRAFGGKAGKGGKSAKQWNLGKSGGDDE